jgi:phenylacetate-CoA ligase
MSVHATRQDLTLHQAAELRTLVRLAAQDNPFWAARLREFALICALPDLADSELLAKFPQGVGFVTKAELAADQAAHPPFGTNLTYPVERYTRFNQTSGTSGAPLRWLDTSDSWSWMVGNWKQVFIHSGVVPGDRVMFAFSFGPFLGFWTAFQAAEELGCLCLPGGGLSTAGRLRLLLDNQATVLCCTPTYALRLGEAAVEEGIDLNQSRIRAILVAGEPGGAVPAVRDRIEALWPGARVWDHHGMTEVGPVSYECPVQRGVLHILEEAFIPEVVDPSTMQPITPGAEGELILTNLGRTGSPLFRYRTGDLVRPSSRSACACGSAEIALEGGILGRCDDMVVVRGVNLYPSAVEAVIRQHSWIAEYRVRLQTVDAMVEVEVDVEPLPDQINLDQCEQALEQALRAAFSLRIPVRLVDMGALPRFEMKARRWVRE